MPHLIGSSCGRTEPELSTDSGDLLLSGTDGRAHELPGSEKMEAAVVLQGGHVLQVEVDLNNVCGGGERVRKEVFRTPADTVTSQGHH